MYIEATSDSGRRFFGRGIRGPVTMRNLLRFRDRADDQDFSDLAPAGTISGREVYNR